MLTVISPAKSLDMTPVEIQATQPERAEDALRLARTARNQTLGQLRSLMAISDDLARLNRDRFKAFSEDPAPEAVKPAAFAFAGDTYQGFEAKTLDVDALRWAQDHLRILSGLYGLLRPLDAIQPYRLEMGCRLKTRRGATLYDYWGDALAQDLNALGARQETSVLVNCASEEYFKAVDRPALALRVVTPRFFEVKDDRPRIVSFFAKRARGAMARFVVENRLTDPADLKGFTAGGYAHDAARSKGDLMVFTRPYPA